MRRQHDQYAAAPVARPDPCVHDVKRWGPLCAAPETAEGTKY